MARRQHLTVSLLLIVFLFLSVSYFFTSAPVRDRAASFVGSGNPLKQQPPPASTDGDSGHDAVSPIKDGAAPSATPSAGGFSIDVDSMPSLDDLSIAPKLENATLKYIQMALWTLFPFVQPALTDIHPRRAELGRATWRFLHTMAARFPDKPTKDEQTAFKSFIELFARLYPCGDCAQHFRRILAKYPPQAGTRSAAAGWLCFAHNLVNERLEKPAFDCNAIGDFYDCGCAEDDDKKGKESKEEGDDPAAGEKKEDKKDEKKE
ncbi:FAD-linked sulfhydryl oxidase ERV2 [Beauveria bassiana]|uniref:Sulfhydryl oxidase n=1 Tax=Beauveria bassiana TaxID=176275 RepID=A0A2N6P274_BEABA|nr:FAD-linked sulfhydryl oxidase ERV2 [Beauveria bassiana]